MHHLAGLALFFVALGYPPTAGADEIGFDSALIEVGVAPSQLRSIKDKITTRNPARVRSLAAWLERQGVSEVGKVLVAFPPLISLHIEETLEVRLAWLKQQEIRNIPHLLTHFPHVLSYRIEEKLEPKITWLREQGVTNIGISEN